MISDAGVWSGRRHGTAVEGPSFVGRHAELEKLAARLARARAGSGAVVALVGEAGIGKTRTALAFLDRARAEGALVVTGTCAEGEWNGPFAPWSQVLGAVVRALGAKAAMRAVGPARGSLAWFVPELASRAIAPALDARDERLRVHRAVTQLLAAAAKDAPLVLFLDDLQWADADSLALLLAVARCAATAPWVILISYREGESEHARALGDVLGAMRDGGAERIPLRGLAPEEVAALVRACAGMALGEGFVRSLYEETVGNPFFVREVIRLLGDEGSLVRARAEPEVTMRQLGVPRNVRDVIGRRVARLDEPAARVLRVACATAAPSEMALLLALTELEPPRLKTAIDAALGSGLMVPVAGSEAYEASHALVRRVVHDALQPDLRARLHRRLGEALEASGETRPGLEARIAGEYEASSAIAGAELGVPHAIEAARQAVAASAYERAATFLRRASALTASAPAHVRAEALWELALAEARVSRSDPASKAAHEAAVALEAAGASPQDIAAFLGEVARELKGGGAAESVWAPLVARGLELENGARSLTWARLVLMTERFEPLAYGAVNLSRALPRDAEAVKRARQAGDEDDYAATLDDSPRTRAEAEQLAVLASGWSRPTAKLRALGVVVSGLVYRHAAFADARVHAKTMLEVATRAGAMLGEADALVYLATCDAALGALGDASASRVRARDLAAAAHASIAPMDAARLGLDAMLVYYAGGDFRGLAELAARATADPAARRSPVGHVAAAIASLGYALAGYAREARSLLGHLANIFERCDARVHHYGVALGCATTAVWHLGARELAEKYRALERGAPPNAGTSPFAARDLNLGRMAALLEAWDEAREHLVKADVILARRGRRPLHAIALHDEASILLRGGQGDTRRARARLGAALRSFRVLEMEPWIVHAHQLMGLPRPAYPDGLTSREVEILAMLAEGRDAAAIASVLGQPGAVAQKEVARARAKIGARGSAAAAAYARDKGLVAPTT